MRAVWLAVVILVTAAVPRAEAALSVQTGLTAEQLVTSLLGGGITPSNVQYTGAPLAAGTFIGGAGILGPSFADGVILSSGLATNAIGPNPHFGNGVGELFGTE